MRSRFSAFALGLGEYLYETLARTHPDRALPRAELVATLGRVRESQRFVRLAILHTETQASKGEVLFFATIFGKSTKASERTDRSFAELSLFVHEEGGWRYAPGRLVPAAHLPPAPPATLDKATFLALADAFDDGA